MRTRMQFLLGFLVLAIISRVGSTKRSKRSKNPIHEHQWPVPDPRKTPSPCRYFVWDMGSAKRFCTCTRLLKDAASTSLWQDSHEQFWLRLSCGSPLLELFPCQKHSLSRCVRCGHDFGAHVRAALENRPSRPFEQLMKVSPAVGGEEIPLEFRKVASSGDAARHADAKQESKAADTGAGDADKVGRDGGRSGLAKWAKGLALVAEAQRTSTIQLSGIGVTSASVQSGFNKVRRKMAEKAKAEEARVRKEEQEIRKRARARVPERSTKSKGDDRGDRRRRRAEGAGRGDNRRSNNNNNNNNNSNAFMRDLGEFVQTYKRVVYP